jgi:hypothetical protein
MKLLDICPKDLDSKLSKQICQNKDLKMQYIHKYNLMGGSSKKTKILNAFTTELLKSPQLSYWEMIDEKPVKLFSEKYTQTTLSEKVVHDEQLRGATRKIVTTTKYANFHGDTTIYQIELSRTRTFTPSII